MTVPANGMMVANEATGYHHDRGRAVVLAHHHDGAANWLDKQGPSRDQAPAALECDKCPRRQARRETVRKLARVRPSKQPAPSDEGAPMARAVLKSTDSRFNRESADRAGPFSPFL